MRSFQVLLLTGGLVLAAVSIFAAPVGNFEVRLDTIPANYIADLKKHLFIYYYSLVLLQVALTLSLPAPYVFFGAVNYKN